MSSPPGVSALLLAAGFGSRLSPLTQHWPKCLMPIGDRPLLDYWLDTIYRAGIARALVNLHSHANAVANYLDRPCFKHWVYKVYEPILLGTAGTLSVNRGFFEGQRVLMVHADNWCQCDFDNFIDQHRRRRPPTCLITMMTFDTENPRSCGIVEVDRGGVVVGFHEKVENPPGCRANGAVYLLEPSVGEWLGDHPGIRDFSTQVLPHFVGRIWTWHNDRIHRDIGTLPALLRAQRDPRPTLRWPKNDAWQRDFMTNPLHRALSTASISQVPGS